MTLFVYMTPFLDLDFSVFMFIDIFMIILLSGAQQFSVEVSCFIFVIVTSVGYDTEAGITHPLSLFSCRPNASLMSRRRCAQRCTPSQAAGPALTATHTYILREERRW
jgi:hypothetical protein